MLNRCVCVCVYLDDILIFSQTEAEHLAHIELVLGLPRRYNLKVKLSKCEVVRSKLKLLGHLVSASGMRKDPAKSGQNQTGHDRKQAFEVRSFLGLENYFRKFSQGNSTMIAPLADLLRGLSAQECAGKLLCNRLPAPALACMKVNLLHYAPIDTEMLALISALEEWRCYLEGVKQFTLVTEHQPSMYLDSATNTHAVHRHARWLDATCGSNCSCKVLSRG
jgi:hypothetical protein